MKHLENAASFASKSDDVFGRIASRYDLLCDLFSFGFHRLWKRQVVKEIARYKWTCLLDSASGTGDIVCRVLASDDVSPNQRVIASDLSSSMLALADQKIARTGKSAEKRVLDAHAMPSIDDESIDLYSISLGLKICDRDRVLREAFRVLKPGGKLVVLEASNISVKWLHNLYLIYMSVCTPLIGFIATGGDASAYRYLLQGVKNFPSAEQLKEEMLANGYKDVRFSRLTLGIVAIHVATKPSFDD